MMPALTGIFVALAKEYSIPSIRYPHGDKLVAPARLNKFLRLSLLSLFGRSMGKAFRKAGLYTTDHLIGFLDSGDLSEDVLLRLLSCMEDGTTELVCHPGFVSPELWDKCIFHLKCEGELSALTSRRVDRFIKDSGIELTTYGKILSEGKR